MIRLRSLALAVATTPTVQASRVPHGIYAHPAGFDIYERGKRVTAVVLPKELGEPAPATVAENPRLLGPNWVADDD